MAGAFPKESPNAKREAAMRREAALGEAMASGQKYWPAEHGAHDNGTIAHALVEAKGFVSDAAVMLGMTPTRLANRIAREAELSEVMENIRIFELDLAEKSLMIGVQCGEAKLITYKLDAHGKGRGYGKITKDDDDGRGGPTISDFAALAQGVAAIAERVALEASGRPSQVIEAVAVTVAEPEPEPQKALAAPTSDDADDLW